MSLHLQLLSLSIFLSLGLAVACEDKKSSALPFADERVREVELIQLEHPLLGGVQKREMLAEDRIPEFVRGLRRSEHRGLYKARTPYVIKFKLKDGSIYELKATDEMFSIRDKDDYYGFDGGAGFLKRFFPKFFE